MRISKGCDIWCKIMLYAKIATMKSWCYRLKKGTFLHPANRLLAWSAWVIYLSGVSYSILAVLTAVLVVAAAWIAPQAFWRSMRRMRWLLCALVVIFAWNTPGVYVMSSWYAPSIEGLSAGIKQALYLIGVIASLQMTLHKMDQALLLSACYQLTRPFTWIGVDNTSFAIRLGLTLHYAEQWLTKNRTIAWQNLGSVFDDIAATQPDTQQIVDVIVVPFSDFDSWVSVGMLFLIGALVV